MVAAAGHPRKAPRRLSASAITRARSRVCAPLWTTPAKKVMLIDTINLIPKYNIPITLRDGTRTPRHGRFPSPPRMPAGGSTNRRARDLGNLLNRN